MDFEFTPEEQAFRNEVRDFLAANLPPKQERRKISCRPGSRRCARKAGLGFPGRRSSAAATAVSLSRPYCARKWPCAKAPPLGTSFMGLAWVGPGIMQYGTQAQKEKFIPDILDSKVTWCTGYSEPNHGSDLAAIQCKAEKVGDHYVVNGQKIWTTGAPWSQWIILLVRTDFDVKVKHDGITCLLVPMDSPGLEVRPIENMAGDKHFAEIFFTDVEVPCGKSSGQRR